MNPAEKTLYARPEKRQRPGERRVPEARKE